jgi:DUF1365 family protein
VTHEFRKSLFMVYLDLAELPEVFRGRWLWSIGRPNLVSFRRQDYLGDPAVPLERAVRDLVEERCGQRPSGPIRLLTHLRTLGIGFNPVSFYYCFDARDESLEALVAEVTSTPWGERHCYVLGGRDDGRGFLRVETAKELHVSPFMGMEQTYRFKVGEPGERLVLSIANHEGGRKVFDATLLLRRRPIQGRSLAGALIRHPAMTAQVIGSIYWQALRLWLKRAPFHPHPGPIDDRGRKDPVHLHGV